MERIVVSREFQGTGFGYSLGPIASISCGSAFSSSNSSTLQQHQAPYSLAFHPTGVAPLLLPKFVLIRITKTNITPPRITSGTSSHRAAFRSEHNSPVDAGAPSPLLAQAQVSGVYQRSGELVRFLFAPLYSTKVKMSTISGRPKMKDATNSSPLKQPRLLRALYPSSALFPLAGQ